MSRERTLTVGELIDLLKERGYQLSVPIHIGYEGVNRAAMLVDTDRPYLEDRDRDEVVVIFGID